MKRTIQSFIERLDICPDTIVSTPFVDYITIGKVLIYFYTQEYSNLLYCGERYHELLRKRVEHNGQIFCMVSDYEIELNKSSLQYSIRMMNGERRYDENSFTFSINGERNHTKEIFVYDKCNTEKIILSCSYNSVTNILYNIKYYKLLNGNILKELIKFIKKIFKVNIVSFFVFAGLDSKLIKTMLEEVHVEYQSKLENNTLYYQKEKHKRYMIIKDEKEKLIKDGKIENIISLINKEYINI